MADQLSLSTLNLIELQRVTNRGLFEEQKLTAQQVVTVSTQQIPARVLAFQYYGSSELGDRVARLNGEINVSFLEGDVDILTV